MKKLVITLLIAAGFAGMGYSQQDAQYSMYMFNGQYINPGYVGSKEAPSVTGLFRRQWAGFNGGPTSASLGFHTPIKKDPNAIGVIATVDRLGVTKMYSLHGQYAFRVRFNEKLKLSLGMQAGFTQYVSDLTEVPLPDPQFQDPEFTVNQSLFLPNFGFGAYLYSKRFYVGASVPHLLNNSLTEKLELEASENVARQYKHYLVTAGYVFGKELANVKFKPSVLMKYVNNAPIDFDINASILIVDRFWIGATYRTGGDDRQGFGESIIGIFEFLATQNLRIGYAYDHTLSELGGFNSGSHEVMVGYDFWRDQQRFVNPRYVTYF